MIDSIRAGRAAAMPSRRVAYAPWLFAAAASIAAAFFGIQNSALKQDVAAPQVVRSYSLLTAGTRSATQTVIEDASKPFALFIDIPPDPPQSKYRIDIVDAGGRAVMSVPVTAEAARDTITVYVPAGHLKSGSYTVVAAGESSTLTRTPLTVR